MRDKSRSRGTEANERKTHAAPTLIFGIPWWFTLAAISIAILLVACLGFYVARLMSQSGYAE